MTRPFKVVGEDSEEAAKPPPRCPLLIISGVVIAKEEVRRLKQPQVCFTTNGAMFKPAAYTKHGYTV
jgi:hypothetical protein